MFIATIMQKQGAAGKEMAYAHYISTEDETMEDLASRAEEAAIQARTAQKGVYQFRTLVGEYTMEVELPKPRPVVLKAAKSKK